jgi:hypothetical protein
VIKYYEQQTLLALASNNALYNHRFRSPVNCSSKLLSLINPNTWFS